MKDFEKVEKPMPESDVRVITRAEYRQNGAGYPDPGRPTHVWVIDARVSDKPGMARQITTGDFSEDEMVWSKDGSKISLLKTFRAMDAKCGPTPGSFGAT